MSPSWTSLQEAHPPSPVDMLRRGTHHPGGGGNVRESLSSCVPDKGGNPMDVTCCILLFRSEKIFNLMFI